MTAPVVLTAALEGPVDEVLLRRLCTHLNVSLGQVYGRAGKSYVISRLPGYNNSARFRHWVVLLDLDREPCAPEAVQHWLPAPARLMRLRVAVREAESWILGDRERLATFLSVSTAKVPTDPEALDDPKRTLVDIAAASRRRAIREDIVPRPGSGQSVGPAYTSRMIEFLQDNAMGWRPEVAATSCDSLRRCIGAISQLIREGF